MLDNASRITTPQSTQDHFRSDPPINRTWSKDRGLAQAPSTATVSAITGWPKP